nr:hypothetical protein CFP56_43074 [Quercus suber]
MDILCENKVIDNWLNPDDAVPFFNKLYYNAHLKKEIYYQKLCKDVNEYCNRRWLRWRNYFNTPWAIFSTTAVAILLIHSFLQTRTKGMNTDQANQIDKSQGDWASAELLDMIEAVPYHEYFIHAIDEDMPRE